MSNRTVSHVAGSVMLALAASCVTDAPTTVELTNGRASHSSLDGPWSAPVNLGPLVNSGSNEQNAVLSRDGLSLIFTSDRPGGAGALDLWVTRRTSTSDAWGAPVNIAALNTPANDFAPRLSIDSHLLFFASNRAGGAGSNDLYLATRSNPHDDLSWSSVVGLGGGVNMPDAENAPFFMQSAEDGPTNMYFNRGNLALNQADIWSAAIGRDGSTLSPATVVPELSFLAANDAAPSIRKDGREVFFFSNRPGTLGPFDIYTSARRSVHHAWSAPAAPLGVNTTFAEITPSLSHDGRILLFGSNRPGGLGGNDLWMSTR